MKILEITKSITILNPLPKSFIKGQLYLLSEYQYNEFRIMCLSVDVNWDAFSKTHKVEYLLKPFNFKSKIVYIHRTGGIGDLIALSSVCNYLHENRFDVNFITQERFKNVFDWFKYPIKIINHTSPLPFKNDVKHNLNINRYGLLEYEGEIEQNKQNWFELFYKSIDNNVNLEIFGRPDLNIDYANVFHSGIIRNRTSDSVLLTLRASANIRSIDFEPVYMALKPIIKDNYDICVHVDNLTQKDIKFIQFTNDKKVRILPKSNLNQFLFDVFDANILISTDTGALHFREGIQKEALGIYNAFSAECRTKYYKYVQTIDVKSNCKHQPCFLHVQKPDSPCLNDKYCLDMKYNNTLIEQLRTFFNKNIVL